MVHGGRDGLHNHDEHGAQLIPHLQTGAGGPGHEDAQRHTDHQRYHKADQANLDGDGGFLGNDLGDGIAFPVFVGDPQVPVQDLDKVVQHLLGQRLGQAQLLQARFDLRVAEFVKIVEVALNRHLTQQHKHDDNDNTQGHQRVQHTFEHVLGQWVLPLSLFDILITRLFTALRRGPWLDTGPAAKPHTPRRHKKCRRGGYGGFETMVYSSVEAMAWARASSHSL